MRHCVSQVLATGLITGLLMQSCSLVSCEIVGVLEFRIHREPEAFTAQDAVRFEREKIWSRYGLIDNGQIRRNSSSCPRGIVRDR